MLLLSMDCGGKSAFEGRFRAFSSKVETGIVQIRAFCNQSGAWG
jgi:hypothetical protein